MPQWLDMLSASNAQTAQFFNFAMDRYDKMVERENQERAFELALAEKGVAMAEAQRVNDFKIEAYKAQNAVNQQRFQHEAMLLPLKMQTAKMELNAASANQAVALWEQTGKMFGEATSPYNLQIAGEAIRTANPKMIYDYNQIKAKHLNDVRAGRSFDPNAFNADVQKILSENSQLPPVDIEAGKWNGELSALLGTLDKGTQAEYNRRNPADKRTRAGILSSLLTSDMDNFARSIAEIPSGYFTDDEVGNIAITRSSLDGFKKAIDREHEKRERLLMRQPDENATPQARELWMKEYEMANQQISFYTKLHDKVLSDAIGGDFDPSDALPNLETDAGSGVVVDPVMEKFMKDYEQSKEKEGEDQGDLTEPRSTTIKKKAQASAYDEIKQSLSYKGSDNETVDLLSGYEPAFSMDEVNENMFHPDVHALDKERDKIASRIKINAQSVETSDLVSLVMNALSEENLGALKGKDIVYRDTLNRARKEPAPYDYLMSFDAEAGWWSESRAVLAENFRNRSIGRHFKSAEEVSNYIYKNPDGTESNEVAKRAKAIQVFTALSYSLMESKMRKPKDQ